MSLALRTMRERLKRVDRALAKIYGEPERREGDPLAGLVETILSQNTNDSNRARAFAAMRNAFPTWEAVMKAPRRQLEAALKPAGLARTRSGRIQDILRSIAEQGTLDLDYLRGLSDEEAEKALLSFHGVGPKTARCVLLFSLGRDVFPIDTHVHRVLTRLEVIPAGMGAEKAHAFVAPLFPKGRGLALHVNLIRHGRDTCHPRNPECGRCVLRRMCPYPGKQIVDDSRKTGGRILGGPE